MAEVVRLRRRNGQIVQGCDIYIGRALYQGGWALTGSKWQNPFKVGDNRAGAIEQYEAYVRSRPDLMAALPELKGKKLGCWCKPLPCHGDVLLKLVSELDSKPPATPPDVRILDDDPLWEELGL